MRGVQIDMVAREGLFGIKLLEDELHEVRSVGRVVWCDIATRQIHAQYRELAAAHGPRYALVTDSPERAMDWMTQPR